MSKKAQSHELTYDLIKRAVHGDQEAIEAYLLHTEVSLAWLLTKVTAPIVGATKMHHVDGAAKATDLILTAEECAYLEAPYVPHALVGVMAQNTAAAAGDDHVWSTGNQEIAK